jgi:hypothetical protein
MHIFSQFEDEIDEKEEKKKKEEEYYNFDTA